MIKQKRTQHKSCSPGIRLSHEEKLDNIIRFPNGNSLIYCVFSLNATALSLFFCKFVCMIQNKLILWDGSDKIYSIGCAVSIAVETAGI